MTVREIQGFFKDAYDADISPSLISRVTDAALEDVEIWRNRRLDEVYPIVYLDGLVVKVRTDALVEKRTVYVALGVEPGGPKELLGLWMAGAEGAEFWLHVMTELHNRGVQDILIACCDGLKGFPQAIEAVFPDTVVQTCIVHLIRNSLRLVAWGNRKAVARSLKPVYGAVTAQQAKDALVAFDEEWGARYPSIAKTWRDQLGTDRALLRVPDRYPQGHLHHQHHRGLERPTSKGAQTEGTLPHRGRRDEGTLPCLAARPRKSGPSPSSGGIWPNSSSPSTSRAVWLSETEITRTESA